MVLRKTFSAFEKMFLGFEKNIFLKTFPGVVDKPFSAFWRTFLCIQKAFYAVRGNTMLPDCQIVTDSCGDVGHWTF